MKKYTLVTTLILLSSIVSMQAQQPDLGILNRFVLFTSAGAVGNTGSSNITGDIGTNVGAITGFGGMAGTAYHADATTAQAATDVLSAYQQLLNTPATISTHPPAFGNGETLYNGVYSIGGAASVSGSLTCDAQGDPNALFIFKAGGALTTAASTTIHLINSASAHNIFWIADGAISMAALTTICGTFIAHNGAIDMGDGSVLEGRLLSTGGAVSVYSTVAFIPVNAVLAADGLAVTGSCNGSNTRLSWGTTNSNTNEITIQQSSDGLHWINLKKITEGEKAWLHCTFLFPNQSTVSSPSFYRLVQKSIGGIIEHGATIRILPCTVKINDRLLIFPNPSTGMFRLAFLGNANDVYWTSVTDIDGKTVFLSPGIPQDINLTKLSSGVYIISVQSQLLQLSYTLLKQ